jgi:hypothetical protein
MNAQKTTLPVVQEAEVLQMTRTNKRKSVSNKTTRVRKEYSNTEVDIYQVEDGKLKLALQKVVSGSEITLFSLIANVGAIGGSIWGLNGAIQWTDKTFTVINPYQFLFVIAITVVKVIEEIQKHQKKDKRTQSKKMEEFLEEIKDPEDRIETATPFVQSRWDYFFNFAKKSVSNLIKLVHKWFTSPSRLL